MQSVSLFSYRCEFFLNTSSKSLLLNNLLRVCFVSQFDVMFMLPLHISSVLLHVVLDVLLHPNALVKYVFHFVNLLIAPFDLSLEVLDCFFVFFDWEVVGCKLRFQRIVLLLWDSYLLDDGWLVRWSMGWGTQLLLSFFADHIEKTELIGLLNCIIRAVAVMSWSFIFVWGREGICDIWGNIRV